MRSPPSLELVMDMMLCGVLVAGLSFWGHHLQPDFSRLTLVAGLTGGGVCALCGLCGVQRRACRLGAMVALAVVAGVLALQAVRSWESSAEGGSNYRIVATLMTVLVAVAVATFARLACPEQPREALQAGVGRQPQV